MFMKPKVHASCVNGQDWNEVHVYVVQLTYPAWVVPNVCDLKSEIRMFAKLVFIASSQPNVVKYANAGSQVRGVEATFNASRGVSASLTAYSNSETISTKGCQLDRLPVVNGNMTHSSPALVQQ